MSPQTYVTWWLMGIIRQAHIIHVFLSFVFFFVSPWTGGRPNTRRTINIRTSGELFVRWQSFPCFAPNNSGNQLCSFQGPARLHSWKPVVWMKMTPRHVSLHSTKSLTYDPYDRSESSTLLGSESKSDTCTFFSTFILSRSDRGWQGISKHNPFCLITFSL